MGGTGEIDKIKRVRKLSLTRLCGSRRDDYCDFNRMVASFFSAPGDALRNALLETTI